MKTTWQVLVNDDKGVHSPEDFRTRRAAEEFAAQRSFWRRDVYILVRKAGETCWSVAYKNGYLHDSNVRGAYNPKNPGVVAK